MAITLTQKDTISYQGHPASNEQWGYFPRVEWPERDIDHSHPSTTVPTYDKVYTSTLSI
jgi:hypothetical protein